MIIYKLKKQKKSQYVEKYKIIFLSNDLRISTLYIPVSREDRTFKFSLINRQPKNKLFTFDTCPLNLNNNKLQPVLKSKILRKGSRFYFVIDNSGHVTLPNKSDQISRTFFISYYCFKKDVDYTSSFSLKECCSNNNNKKGIFAC